MTWKLQAACLGRDTNTFYEPLTGSRLAQARAVCAGCPVRLRCLAEALRLKDFHGVHGGTTGDERRALLRTRRRDQTRLRRRARSVCLHRPLHAEAFVLLIAHGGVLTMHAATAEGAWSHTEHGPGRCQRLAAALAEVRRGSTQRRQDPIEPITGERAPTRCLLQEVTE